MIEYRVITTANDFPTIVQEAANWIKRPIELVSIDNHNWHVLLPPNPLGRDTPYYVVRQGIRFRLEARILS